MQLAERCDFSRSAAHRRWIIHKLLTIDVGLSRDRGFFSGAPPLLKISALFDYSSGFFFAVVREPSCVHEY
jgi:hypothetical protein